VSAVIACMRLKHNSCHMSRWPTPQPSVVYYYVELLGHSRQPMTGRLATHPSKILCVSQTSFGPTFAPPSSPTAAPPATAAGVQIVSRADRRRGMNGRQPASLRVATQPSDVCQLTDCVYKQWRHTVADSATRRTGNTPA